MKRYDEIKITAAVQEDAPNIAALLSEAGLACGDVEQHLARFVVARVRGKIIGAVGAQVCGADALLRSLVVAPEWRGAGLGGRLVDELECIAAAWGVQQWWLLTTTAERFFAARGFRVTTRCGAPAAVRVTGQFSGGCGSAAVCLTRERAGGAR